MTGRLSDARAFSNYSCTVTACTSGGCTESPPTFASTREQRMLSLNLCLFIIAHRLISCAVMFDGVGGCMRSLAFTLANSVVDACSVDAFEARLDNFWLHHMLKSLFMSYKIV